MKITYLCKSLRCLPGPGGLLQQDPYLVEGMIMVLDASNEKQEKDSKRGTSR